MNFYSNGKLLITGEYTVLDGAKALAIPTQFGQTMEIISIETPVIQWKSLDEENEVWLECFLDIADFKLIKIVQNTASINENSVIRLQSILKEIKKLNPDFLKDETGVLVINKLNFPNNWGLGSSSTLINNLANWAKVDAFELLQNTFGGSGYDIACAQNNTPILFQLIDNEPKIEVVHFNPIFKNQLYFIHLNKKQDSQEGIEQYRRNQKNIISEIVEISTISDEILKVSTLIDFEKLIAQHEQIISKIINQKTIQQTLFADYFGQIKSLGAWGGDFILATGNENTANYFKKKGFETVIPFEQMIL